MDNKPKSLDNNKWLGEVSGYLVLLNNKGKYDKYLVDKDGRRQDYLHHSKYLKRAGLTLTEDTEAGVIVIDCIPEPWRSKVIEFEKQMETE